MVNVNRNNLAVARDLVDAARKYDVPLRNHRTSAMSGVVALRQRDVITAGEAFTAAITRLAD